MRDKDAMNKAQMYEIVRNQLAIDYNCKPDDFFKEGIIITEAKKSEGRRSLPFIHPRCEMITMGHSVIVNVSKDVMPFVKRKLNGKSKYDAMNMPFVYGLCHYYLPDIDKVNAVYNDTSYEFRLLEQAEIRSYYKYEGFKNALQYNEDSLNPEILGIAVFDKDVFIGICCAAKDSEKMCQIGVDVSSEYRNQHIAATAVKMLTKELLDRGLIPYYFTDNTNLASQRTAAAAGYFPAWNHSFKSRLHGKPFAFLNYIRF